jgi:hypothetical protein
MAQPKESLTDALQSTPEGFAEPSFRQKSRAV